MPKRLTAALGAVLVFASVLAIVPLATSGDAEAHTKTVRRCAFSLLTGTRSCWDEKVPHTHPVRLPPQDCVPDMPLQTQRPTETIQRPDGDSDAEAEAAPDSDAEAEAEPDSGAGASGGSDQAATRCNVVPVITQPVPTTTQPPPPPTTTEPSPPPKCPPGEKGTPPNCEPDVCPTGQRGTPPNCVPDVCPTGYTGTPPNCVKEVCPTGYTGTPPNCVKEVCPPGKIGTPPNCVDRQTTTYTVKPCTPFQAPTETYQRHKHPLAGGTTDTECHRHDNSHCPAGQTEQGAHGSQDCVDSIFTRIAHLIKQGSKAAIKAAVEALKDEVEDLDIDWDKFGTDPVETSKLLELLNPVLEQSNLDLEVYTLNDLQTLWSDIGENGRRAAAGGGTALACYIGVEAILVKTTKGKSLKAANRHAVAGLLSAVCGGLTSQVPVPDPDDDDSDDDSDDDDSSDDDSSDDDASDDDSSDDDSSDDDASDDDSSARQPNDPAAPSFDPARDCYRWLSVIRACINVDPNSGESSITYH